jgi:hypothetical protein
MTSPGSTSAWARDAAHIAAAIRTNTKRGLERCCVCRARMGSHLPDFRLTGLYPERSTTCASGPLLPNARSRSQTEMCCCQIWEGTIRAVTPALPVPLDPVDRSRGSEAGTEWPIECETDCQARIVRTHLPGGDSVVAGGAGVVMNPIFPNRMRQRLVHVPPGLAPLEWVEDPQSNWADRDNAGRWT